MASAEQTCILKFSQLFQNGTFGTAFTEPDGPFVIFILRMVLELPIVNRVPAAKISNDLDPEARGCDAYILLLRPQLARI